MRARRGRGLASMLLLAVAEIFWVTKVVPGILILAAIAVASWRMAALVLLGAAASSLAGKLLCATPDDVRAGLQGFCGALVGAAAFAALGSTWLGVLCAVLGGLACGPVTWALNRFFKSRPLEPLALPCLTAPFCLVAGAVLAATSGHHVASAPQDPGTQGPSVFGPWMPGSWGTSSLGQAFATSLLTNISQVVLVDGVIPGFLILLALFLGHWRMGVAASVGSLVGSLGTLAAHAATTDETARAGITSALGHGLLGYSGVLVAIAMAAIYLNGSWQPWLLAVVGTLAALGLSLLLRGVPGVYTWPFVLVTWLLFTAVHYLPGFQRSGPAPGPTAVEGAPVL